METLATPLSVLMDKDTAKLESNPSSAFIDYDGWLAADFNVDTDTVLSPCKTMPSPRDRFQVLQWAPHEGNSDSTVSVILEQLAIYNPRGEIKIVFGQLPLETMHHVYSLPSMEPSPECASFSPTTTWITLAAKVPEAQHILLPPNGQVLISVYFYDADNHDMVIDSREIGTFRYIEMPLACKRALVYNLIDECLQQRTDSTDGTTDSNQLLHVLASYDDSQTHSQQHTNGSTTTSSSDCDTAMWITQQIHHHQQSDQQYMFENMNAADITFADNLSFDLDSAVSKGCGSSNGNQYKQKLPSYALYDNVIDTNMGQRGDYSSCNSMASNGVRQYNDYDYQSGGMSSQANDNDRTSNINNHYIYAPANDSSHHALTLTQTNNKPYLYDNRLSTGVKNTGSYTETGAQPSYSMPSIHPFAGLLNKANLKICGDLMQMTFQWSTSEWQKGRRLVRFWRRQNTGNVENNHQVECGFEPIEYYNHQQEQQQQLLRRNGLSSSTASLSDRLPYGSLNSPISPLDTHTVFNNQPVGKTQAMSSNSSNATTTTTKTSLVVSCIYWKERNDYFITSVDCIYLLEGLIGVQFTVEEKNRIRRNLEGFRPLTVSKCKTGCADFFKLIMGFPHPKPRHIEKDVKVFAWKTLPNALRKIIRKYTSNYTNSSTVAPAPPVWPSSSSSMDPLCNYQYVHPSSMSAPSHIQPIPPSFVHRHQQHHQHHQRRPPERQYCY